MAGELTDEKLGAMVMAGIGAFPHGSVTPFSAKDIGACALMVGDLRNEVASLRSILSDLLRTQQAHEEAFDAEVNLCDDPEADFRELQAAHDRSVEAALDLDEAWDRARSLLAGEGGNGG